MSIRDLRKRSRLSLHGAMSFAAVYNDVDAGTTANCTVREHSRTQMFGDMAGFDYAPAERAETVPKIIALVSEVSPVRGGIFAVARTKRMRSRASYPRTASPSRAK